jgi:hypothetical protein
VNSGSNDKGADDALQGTPGAGRRKPWIRPDYEAQEVIDTEAGLAGGGDASSSVS